MAFFAIFTRDSALQAALAADVDPRFALARTSSWPRLLYLVKERPVTGLVVDGAALGPDERCVAAAVTEVRARFPSVPVVFVARPRTDPHTLLRLGRAGIESLVLVSVDDLGRALPRACGQAYRQGTSSLVAGALSPYLPRREADLLLAALEGVIRGWSAEQLARGVGLSRPHLSERLKGAGLPSAGHLLVWARLLHAGRWLQDPGRTGESVSRQLEYSSGAALRRALRNYLGTTPTQTVEAGGFSFVLDRFLEACSVDRDRSADRTAA
jgi:AraC-like DNA-binding protein